MVQRTLLNLFILADPSTKPSTSSTIYALYNLSLNGAKHSPLTNISKIEMDVQNDIFVVRETYKPMFGNSVTYLILLRTS